MSTAHKYSMDIPHVTAVEYPLIVNNTTKATNMVGGKQKIALVVNSDTEKQLELNLRPNDPFHHPIQSSFSNNEKILLKVSIPKRSLPKDYKQKSVKELIKLNREQNGPPHKATPVAIIDKTFLFKAIADFQINTSDNQQIQEYKKDFLKSTNWHQINTFFENNDGLLNMQDYITKENEYFKNGDHQFPPPPVLSSIRFPFDYKYQKNPYTTAVKDVESGEVKVVSTKNTVKLYTKMIDVHSNEIPTEPHPKLQESLVGMPVNSPLYKCIQWLRDLFAIKPIWLRKQLEDLVLHENNGEMGKYLKQAIPYVSFLYKSGPWRFCNIKYGVNPLADSSYWVYQSEYFRIPGLKFIKRRAAETRIIPKTIKESQGFKSNNGVFVSDYLFFNGVSLPSTVTFQIGDLLDSDITTIIEDSQKSMHDDFLREKVDLQDGWINKQTMQVIRRIVRYKLNRIAREEPIDQGKVIKIINTNYTEDDDEDDEDDMTKTGIPDEEIDAEGEIDEDEEEIDEKSVLKRMDGLNEGARDKVEQLLGYIKQDEMRDAT